jgi:hypothetical protein
VFLQSTQSLKYSAAIILALISPVYGAVVFFDDFESGSNDAALVTTAGAYSQTPDVTGAQSDGYTSGGINTTLWVKANQGFGATRQGLVDESHGDFTDPVGEQAYTFRYTNSGITTQSGLIGALVAGSTYTVTFDVVLDGHNAANTYDAYLLTFNGGARNDARGTAGSTSTLARLNGTYGNATYQTFSFDYTADGTEGTLGHDVALRFDGASNSAIIDNVTVDVVAVPEPVAAMLGGLGGLLLLRRRRSKSGF